MTIEKEQMLTVLDWGLLVVINPRVITDNTNLIDRIEYLINECKKIDKYKMLVDASKSERNISISKMFSAAKVLQKLGHYAMKIAIVGAHLVDSEDSKFMVTTAKNRGFEIDYFRSREDALNWIVK